MISSDENLDAVAWEAHWYGDCYLDAHNDDALWAYTIRVKYQYWAWNWQDMNDIPFLHLMAMGIYNWECPDQELH